MFGKNIHGIHALELCADSSLPDIRAPAENLSFYQSLAFAIDLYIMYSFAISGIRQPVVSSAMISELFPIPAFADNYIWAIRDAESSDFAVVDPGDPEPVKAYAEQHDLKLSHILITHHHADHTGGLKELISHYHPHVIGPEPSGIAGIEQFVHEGDKFNLFGHQWNVFEVPGHTLDHVAYYSNTGEPGILFCGDTLFAAGCGRLFEGSAEMMSQSLNKFANLPPATRVYCTHEYTMANLKFALAVEVDNARLQKRFEEEQAKRQADQPTLPSSIDLELSTNPFLRCDQAEIIASVSSHSGKQLQNSVETFAALRNWKDNF